MTRTQLEELAKRATDYLSSGGLFNPELADHQAVSVLIRECRDAFRSMLAQEPVAWMFVTRDRKRGQRHEFAAIDWVPDPDSSEEFVSKEPLYAAPVPAVDLEAFKAEAMPEKKHG